jgi:uncharacterized membrane protein
VDQTPDQHITWRAIEGAKNDGTVSFASDEVGQLDLGRDAAGV